MRACRVCCWIVAAVLLGVVTAGPTPAMAGLEEEAVRQLEFAEEDLAAGNYERAAASAASALRLNPALQEALVTRALALKGLDRLEDAAGLLRAYRDLRGSLPLDDRVEPALAEIERLLSVGEGPAEEADAEDTPVQAGPLAIFYGPGSDQSASEAAFTAARPFLSDQPAAAILALTSVLPRGDGVIVVGADALDCGGAAPAGTLDEQITAAKTATADLEPEAAAAAVALAERHLACGAGAVEREALAGLLSVRATGRWFAGEPEIASRLWRELFQLVPGQPTDSALPPAAQAFQLDAKARAAEDPLLGTVRVALQEGWTVWIDGTAVTSGAVQLPAGRRIVRLVGPEGETAGAVFPLTVGASVLVGTSTGLQQAVFQTDPEPMALKWLGGLLALTVSQQGATAALVVDLGRDPPSVRRFDGLRSLALTTGKRRRPAARAATGRATGPHPGSVALLGAGLASAAAGVIVAALAHRDGVSLRGEVDSFDGWADRYADYEAVRNRERVGAGLAIGGGVVATVGAVTFAIPSGAKPRAREEVANR
jgi:tetratricopeptide (TPR) repeat protein